MKHAPQKIAKYQHFQELPQIGGFSLYIDVRQKMAIIKLLLEMFLFDGFRLIYTHIMKHGNDKTYGEKGF